eukprot:TCONS_00070690-protein
MFPKVENVFHRKTKNTRRKRRMVYAIGVIWSLIGITSLLLLDPFTFTAVVAAFSDVHISAAQPIPCKIIRKQFTEGVIQLPQYLQQIKSCKEIPSLKRQIPKQKDTTTRQLRQLPTNNRPLLPWQQLYNELLQRKRQQTDQQRQRSLIEQENLQKQFLQHTTQPMVQQSGLYKPQQLDKTEHKKQSLTENFVFKRQKQQQQPQQRRLNRRQFTQPIQPPTFTLLPTQKQRQDLQQKELIRRTQQQFAYMKWFTALKEHQQQLLHQQQPAIKRKQDKIQPTTSYITQALGYNPKSPFTNYPLSPGRGKVTNQFAFKTQQQKAAKITTKATKMPPKTDWKILKIPKGLLQLKNKNKPIKARENNKAHEKLVFKIQSHPSKTKSVVRPLKNAEKILKVMHQKSPNKQHTPYIAAVKIRQKLQPKQITNSKVTLVENKISPKISPKKSNKMLNDGERSLGKGMEDEKSKTQLQDLLKTIKISDFQKLHGKTHQIKSNKSKPLNTPLLTKDSQSRKGKPDVVTVAKTKSPTITQIETTTTTMTTANQELQTTPANNQPSKNDNKIPPPEIKTNTELEQALQNLLSTDTQQNINSYYPNYASPYYDQNAVQTQPNFYIPPSTYPWWQQPYREYGRSVIQDLPGAFNPHMTSFPSFSQHIDDSRVRKTFVDEEAKIAESEDGIRSFLSKHKSDTSLFQNEVEAKDDILPSEGGPGSPENGHLLTLKDYEAFIAHPTNSSLKSIENSPEVELQEPGETRTMDNIVNGDDDDEVIAEAKLIKEQSLAKAAIQSDNGRRKDVLREQESLRKLEHDKLIERYGHPPANPMEYLAQVFQELDDDTKNLETANAIKKEDIQNGSKAASGIDNRKVAQSPSEPILGETKSTLELKSSDNQTSKTLNINSTDSGVNDANQTLSRNGASLKGVDPLTVKNDDSSLLDSVFEKINVQKDNSTTKVKRSPIIDADLEPWTNRHKYNQPINIPNSDKASLTSTKFPLGDIADIAQQVNKRSDIPKAWTADDGVSMGANTDHSRLTYSEVKRLFTDIESNKKGSLWKLSVTKRSNGLKGETNAKLLVNEGNADGFLR